MHSRKKVPKDEAKEKERLQKATKFSGALTKLLQLKKDGCKDIKLLPGIADLLYVSPDFYTLWNYRREILIALKEKLEIPKVMDTIEDGDTSLEVSSNLDLEELCKNELTFIENCLKVNYKSYGTWHHRYWLIEFMNEPNLHREIQLCNQFLQMDERNFHCWNYRRFVVKLANIGPLEELSFSKDKINDNFSNFSSWYYRSSLLKSLYSNGHDHTEIQSNIDDDYNRIQEAIYTDPSDQSVWLYLRWLFSVFSQGLESLSGKMYLSSPVIQWKTFTWTSNVSTTSPNEYLVAIELSDYLPKTPVISLAINQTPVQLSDWTAANDFIWFSRAIFDAPFEDGTGYTFNFTWAAEGNAKKANFPSVTFKHVKSSDAPNYACFTYKTSSSRDALTRVDSEKYQSLRDLLDLEPDNKWLNFTLAWLESNDDAMNSIIDKLIEIDNLRENYYKDLRSKIVWNKFLSDRSNLEKVSLSMVNLRLHSLRETSQLVHLQYLDLSHNELIKLGATFSPLLSLKYLILDSNSIYIVDDKLKLPSLTILSLANNRIGKWQPISTILSILTSLKHLVLFDNPILEKERLDRSLLEETVGNRDLKIYLERTEIEEASIKSTIETELQNIGKRIANVQMEAR